MVAHAISSAHLRSSDQLSYRRPGSLHARLEAVWQQRDHERRTLPAWLRDVHHSRAGRIFAGLAGVLMGLGMFASAAVPELRDTFVPTAVLIAALPAMGLAYALGRLIGRPVLELRLRHWLRMGDSVSSELARLSHESTDRHARELVYGMEASSIAWPMMALALLAPLAIHLLAYTGYVAVQGDVAKVLSDDFSEWIAFSGLIVGHAHLYLAVASGHFANTLRLGQPESLRNKGWVAWAVTVGVAAVPGVVLLLLPPLITAATGVLFIPAMFFWARRTVARERRWLSSLR